MIQSILHLQNRSRETIPDFKDMDTESRMGIVHALLISGCEETAEAINEKLLGDHVLGNFMLSLMSGGTGAKHYAMMQFETDVIAALEPIIQSGIEQYNQETNDLQSLTGDQLVDAGHHHSDF